MYKIKIKISPEALFLIQKMENKYANFTPTHRLGKVQKSIRWELFQRLSSACISYSNNPNGKARTLTMSYHLADRLYDDIVFTLSQNALGFYESNMLELLKNELHQKLL